MLLVVRVPRAPIHVHKIQTKGVTGDDPRLNRAFGYAFRFDFTVVPFFVVPVFRGFVAVSKLFLNPFVRFLECEKGIMSKFFVEISFLRDICHRMSPSDVLHLLGVVPKVESSNLHARRCFCFRMS